MVEIAEKNIEWINHLDSLYNKTALNSNNPSYYYYPDIQIEIESVNLKLIYRKHTKTQILFGDCFGRRTYLSDVDIINIIVSSEDEVYSVICEILMLYIRNPITDDVNFKINNQDFYYKSIIQRNYNNDKLNILRMNFFETTGDLNIKYIDLITLINLIINKEFLMDVFRGTDRVLRQSKKFLILSKFYRDREYSEELQNIGYDTSLSIEEVYYNNKVGKKIDLLFDKFSF
ncbi:hypothetical protein [Sutcliffiella horikoshii]|uniref:hypothetical protein n=1 Tax=Sutcliffiella horikoshii TaxID=79883 RepID=UPI00384BD88B